MENVNDIDYNDLKNISKRVEEMQKDSILIRNKHVLDAIGKEINTRPIIPEAVFRQFFLLTFVRYIKNKGELLGTAEEIQQDDYNLRKWLELAGGPYNEVDVIGPDNSVVLTVPSLYLDNTNVVDKLTEFDFVGMVKSYERKSSVLPQIGENDINNRMQHMPKFIDTSGSSAYVQKWIEVANYYKRIMEPEVKSTQPHPKADVKKVQEDLGIEF